MDSETYFCFAFYIKCVFLELQRKILVICFVFINIFTLDMSHLETISMSYFNCPVSDIRYLP